MINKELLNKIILECRDNGHDVKVRDICFCLLNNIISDDETVFRCLFDVDAVVSGDSIKNYAASPKIKFLFKQLKPYVASQSRKKEDRQISFDENLAYMLQLKRETEEGMKKGEVDKTAGLKILSDITVKLNDKFNIVEEAKEQMVVVDIKYNNICECGREIYIPTKEDLIKEYNLIENKK